MTVAISLSALLIFPLYFLRSFAYAGVGVILVSMAISVFSLPALLAVPGPRVDAWRVIRRRERADGGGWHRVATTVMKRPVVVAAAGITFLVALGVPFLGVEWGVPDDRVLPPADDARVASDVLRDDFGSADANSFAVIVRCSVGESAIVDYAGKVSLVDGVDRVDSSVGRFVGGRVVVAGDPALARFAPAASLTGDATWLNVVPGVEPISAEAESMVAAIRAIPSEFEIVEVGGDSAAFVDSKEAIFSRVPLAAALIVVATFVLLFLMFGSVLVPLKAIVLNTLSLSATFGLVVWVFRDGNGAGLLGFTATGLTDTSMPILMFCVAFGLSMDYEVFLLSRMKEEYDRTGDNDLAVATGLEKTGRLVTAAALLLSITFLAFATSG